MALSLCLLGPTARGQATAPAPPRAGTGVAKPQSARVTVKPAAVAVLPADPSEPPRLPPSMGTPADRALKRTAVVPADDTASLPPPVATTKAATKAIARVEGMAAPGLKIVLDAADSTGEDLRYFWVQTKGPKIALTRPDAPRVQVLVPSDAAELGFALVVAGKGGVDRKDVAVPLLLHETPSLPEAELTADAGDDQTAIVGHRVTLNGARSVPREGLAYRWIQVEGPKPAAWIPSKWVCTFVPIEPGVYRFLLVVAAKDAISEPSEVRVAVAALAPPELKAGNGSSPSIEATIRDGLARLDDGGGRLASALATDFDEVARRLPLYRTYEDLFSEISRRLDATLPKGEAARASWDRDVLDPLSSWIVKIMASEGLDLNNPESETKVLTEAQKSRLAGIFHAAARGCRAAGERAEGGTGASRP